MEWYQMHEHLWEELNIIEFYIYIYIIYNVKVINIGTVSVRRMLRKWILWYCTFCKK